MFLKIGKAIKKKKLKTPFKRRGETYMARCSRKWQLSYTVVTNLYRAVFLP
jgi:hypothetical protein